MAGQAIILAGGKGTRLASRLGGAPKPLIDVLGVPLLERQLVQLSNAGFDRAVILVNHRADLIERFCADRADRRMNMTLVDDGEPAGTAGAVFRAMDGLDDEFLVVYGDTLFDLDFERFQAFHDRDPDAAATLFLHPNDHPADSDLVEVDDAGSILAFHAYPHPQNAWLPNMVNAALYVVRKRAMEARSALFPPGEIVDFAKDFFPRILGEGERLRGYISPEYIKDIGTPGRLDRACGDLASGKVAAASLRERQTAVFLDRDGTLNVPNGHIFDPGQFELFPFSARAVQRLNASRHRVVVVTNQPVVARGDCSVPGLAAIHAKMETLLGREGAFVERIYYCPHHPDSGFEGEVAALKKVCDCRKPAPGLLRQAQRDLNLDLGSSWLIGDSAADLAAAEACGVTSVLVRTGAAADTTRLEVVADFVFDDVLQAAEFIVQGYEAIAGEARDLANRIAPGADLFVAGQSKSGKSTLARTLRRELRRQGRPAVVIALDRWLMADDERGPGLDGRFDVEGMSETLRAARARAAGAVELAGLPLFSLVERRRVAGAPPVGLTPETIVIWEGVSALGLAERSGGLESCVYIDTDEERRRQRVVGEYVRRGHDVEAASGVYRARLSDEIEPVMVGKMRAPKVLTLDPCFEGLSGQ
jgi:histidinol-phosphate phosphatase family protein